MERSVGISVLLLACAFVSASRAAFESKDLGAGSRSALKGDATTIYRNPAGLRLLERAELDSFYTQLFGMSRLSYDGAALALPTRVGSFGLAYDRFGPDAYQEQQLVLAHAFSPARRLFFGCGLRVLSLKIEGFGSAVAWAGDAGVILQPTEKFAVGLAGKNLNRAAIGAAGEPLPSGFLAEAAFEPMDGFRFSADWERMDREPALLRGGMEIALAPSFRLRGALEGNPPQFLGGFGAGAGFLRLDYAYVYHSDLPGSHHFSVGLLFGPSAGAPGKKSVEPQAADANPGPINLATAGAEDLERIPGVGAATAEAILRYRQEHGFSSFDDLLAMPGLRRNVFTALKDHAVILPKPPQGEPPH